jgi:hypothetical protein
MYRLRLPLLAGFVLALAALPGCYSDAELGGPTAPGDVSVADFHQDLAPYGRWIESERFGPVFKPDAPPEFVPYETNGRWVYGDEGWEFESIDPWGPITYHYGRWYKDHDLGWVWAPDTNWGPSWVEWREGGPYVGWYVMPPLGWSYDAYGWVWVRTSDFVRPYLAAHVIRSDEVRSAWVAAKPVARGPGRFGGQWSIGPSPHHIAAVAGTSLPRPRISAHPGLSPMHGPGGAGHSGGHGGPVHR